MWLKIIIFFFFFYSQFYDSRIWEGQLGGSHLGFLMWFQLVVGCNCSLLKAQLRWRFKMAHSQDWQLLLMFHRELSWLLTRVPTCGFSSMVVSGCWTYYVVTGWAVLRAEAIEPFLSYPWMWHTVISTASF